MLLHSASWRTRLERLATMIGGSFVFLAVSAPLWMVFLNSLASSATPYDAPEVHQLPPALLLGLFDDLFYRELMPAEWHVDPSANFLLLMGILWAVADFDRLRKNGFFLATCLAVVLPLGMVFGIIPPKWIEAAPLIKSIWHVDNTFSCPLFILFFVFAGFGLRNCFEKFASGAAWSADWKRTWLYLGVLAAGRTVFPVHPRTAERLNATGVSLGAVRLLQPVRYLEMLDLLDGAYAVVTDSGGVQEETTALGVPCFTLRENTERPVTITCGTNRLVPNPSELSEAVLGMTRSAAPRRPEGWDGHAAERIVEALAARGSTT